MTEEEQVDCFGFFDACSKFTLIAFIGPNNRRALGLDKVKSRRKNLCENEK